MQSKPRVLRESIKQRKDKINCDGGSKRDCNMGRGTCWGVGMGNERLQHQC